MSVHIPKIYFFINELNKDYIKNLEKNIAIIYRNYNRKIDLKKLIEFQKACKINKRYFYLANYPKIAAKLCMDGVYIPSFNKKINLVYMKRKNFLVMGSAHKIQEIKIKEQQNVSCIFLSPLFLTNKSNKHLGINKFKKLSNETNRKIIALGGLRKNNLHKLKILNIHGFASISLFEKD